MRIIKPYTEILSKIDGDEILSLIELAGRVCYKSEEKVGEGTAEKLIKSLIKRGHESVIEHFSVTVRFVCDRGVSHEIVRHRLASFSQESTRYCNYADDKFNSEITFIEPCFYYESSEERRKIWENACAEAEKHYFALTKLGAPPEEARNVLPNSVKTEVVMTANMREWRHFFKLRCSPAAHPQMRELAQHLLKSFKEKIPVLFEDI